MTRIKLRRELKSISASQTPTQNPPQETRGSRTTFGELKIGTYFYRVDPHRFARCELYLKTTLRMSRDVNERDYLVMGATPVWIYGENA